MLSIFHKTLTYGLFIIGLVATSTSFGATSDLIISSQDVPTPVQTNDKQLIVYELHIVNQGEKTRRIGRIEVRDTNNKLLNAYSDTKLAQNSFMYKEGKAIKEPSIELQPKMGAFVYIWVALDKDARAPTQLNNKIWSITVNKDKSSARVKTWDFVLPVQQTSPPVLGAPLQGNNWVAVASIAENSYHRRTILPIEGHFYLAQRFAIDWEQISPDGRESHGNMHKNKNWNAFGHKVLAVADGTVVSMRDAVTMENIPPGLPNPPPDIVNTPGNFVILKIKQNKKDYYVFYGHMQPGSIKVNVGDTVTKGQVIGVLGNTGNSGAPHLHLHVSDSNDPLKTNGLPFVFDKLKLTGVAHAIDGDYGIFLPEYYSKPKRFKNIIPRADAIVNFE